MENPCLTFITPTILAGDKSLADVVAHEISHSWTGNLVTNKTFEHFWLNEGFTMFVERKILGRMFGEDMRQFSAGEGLKALNYSVETMGKDNPLTQLVVDLTGVHPDDSFSTIPYEKGHTFLYYLETQLGGPEDMDAFLRAYIEKFKYRAILTEDFKAFLYEFFSEKKAILDEVDWNGWLHTPGMPPVIPEYRSTLAKAPRDLVNRWLVATNVDQFSNDEFAAFTAKQKLEFFSVLLDDKRELGADKFAKVTELYGINSIINAEIRFCWLRLGLLNKWEKILPHVESFLSVVGRMKFVTPLFRDMYNWQEKRQFALDFYQKIKPGMMYVTAHAVEKALKLKDGPDTE